MQAHFDGSCNVVATNFDVVRLDDAESVAARRAVKLLREFLVADRERAEMAGEINRNSDPKMILPHSGVHWLATVAHWRNRSQVRMEWPGQICPPPDVGHGIVVLRWLGAACSKACQCFGLYGLRRSKDPQQVTHCLGSASTHHDDCSAVRARLEEPASKHEATMEALASAFFALESVSLRCLPERLSPMLPTPRTPSDVNESIIDAFFYPGCAGFDIPCVAHLDPGILTLVVDDAPGLEVLSGSDWLPLKSGPTDAIAIVGRTWARFDALAKLPASRRVTACLHRVRTAQSPPGRCSVAFEIRPSSRGALALAREEARRESPNERMPCGQKL
eukprot:TRINITY_DN37673_c0_g1_i1.p1 TRINITY_DN37673_c0_g1~~TRINITY_DN37673_c0_g1_i1.p1  ORF type:complete len:333 (+),score=35.57 TRINITY_DN37673_c0_g1_i1:118-1116(+)